MILRLIIWCRWYKPILFWVQCFRSSQSSLIHPPLFNSLLFLSRSCRQRKELSTTLTPSAMSFAPHTPPAHAAASPLLRTTTDILPYPHPQKQPFVSSSLVPTQSTAPLAKYYGRDAGNRASACCSIHLHPHRCHCHHNQFNCRLAHQATSLSQLLCKLFLWDKIHLTEDKYGTLQFDTPQK